MTSRKELKREQTILIGLLSSSSLSLTNPAERTKLQHNLDGLKDRFRLAESSTHNNDSDKAYLIEKREALKSNKSLNDIFSGFWLALISKTNNGELSKSGFIQFNLLIQRALMGKLDDETALQQAETDWKNEISQFGALNLQGFFDYLLELLDTWDPIMTPQYYAAFTWSLLDAIVDTKVHPPRLKSIKDVPHIMKIDNEYSVLKKYFDSKDLTAAMAIQNEFVLKIPEVQKRLQLRKYGTTISVADADIISAMSKATLSQASTNPNPMEDEDEDPPHDPEPAHINTSFSPTTKLPTKSPSLSSASSHSTRTKSTINRHQSTVPRTVSALPIPIPLPLPGVNPDPNPNPARDPYPDLARARDLDLDGMSTLSGDSLLSLPSHMDSASASASSTSLINVHVSTSMSKGLSFQEFAALDREDARRVQEARSRVQPLPLPARSHFSAVDNEQEDRYNVNGHRRVSKVVMGRAGYASTVTGDVEGASTGTGTGAMGSLAMAFRVKRLGGTGVGIGLGKGTEDARTRDRDRDSSGSPGSPSKYSHSYPVFTIPSSRTEGNGNANTEASHKDKDKAEGPAPYLPLSSSLASSRYVAAYQTGTMTGTHAYAPQSLTLTLSTSPSNPNPTKRRDKRSKPTAAASSFIQEDFTEIGRVAHIKQSTAFQLKAQFPPNPSPNGNPNSNPNGNPNPNTQAHAAVAGQVLQQLSQNIAQQRCIFSATDYVFFNDNTHSRNPVLHPPYPYPYTLRTVTPLPLPLPVQYAPRPRPFPSAVFIEKDTRDRDLEMDIPEDIYIPSRSPLPVPAHMLTVPVHMRTVPVHTPVQGHTQRIEDLIPTIPPLPEVRPFSPAPVPVPSTIPTRRGDSRGDNLTDEEDELLRSRPNSPCLPPSPHSSHTNDNNNDKLPQIISFNPPLSLPLSLPNRSSSSPPLKFSNDDDDNDTISVLSIYTQGGKSVSSNGNSHSSGVPRQSVPGSGSRTRSRSGQSLRHPSSLVKILLDSKELLKPGMSALASRKMKGTYGQQQQHRDKRNNNNINMRKSFSESHLSYSSNSSTSTTSVPVPVRYAVPFVPISIAVSMLPEPGAGTGVGSTVRMGSTVSTVGMGMGMGEGMVQSNSISVLSSLNSDMGYLSSFPQLYVGRMKINGAGAGTVLDPGNGAGPGTGPGIEALPRPAQRSQFLVPDKQPVSDEVFNELIEDEVRSFMGSIDSSYKPKHKPTVIHSNNNNNNNKPLGRAAVHDAYSTNTSNSTRLEGVIPEYAESFYVVDEDNMSKSLDSLGHHLPNASNTCRSPWLPQELVLEMEHDRTNHLLAWEERRMLMRTMAHDPSESRCIIKRQVAIREAFESYVKTKK